MRYQFDAELYDLIFVEGWADVSAVVDADGDLVRIDIAAIELNTTCDRDRLLAKGHGCVSNNCPAPVRPEIERLINQKSDEIHEMAADLGEVHRGSDPHDSARLGAAELGVGQYR